MTHIDTLEHSTAKYTRIDIIDEVFGELHRVWNNTQLLGTFYKNLNGEWIAQKSLPDFSTHIVTCKSFEQAVWAIA